MLSYRMHYSANMTDTSYVAFLVARFRFRFTTAAPKRCSRSIFRDDQLTMKLEVGASLPATSGMCYREPQFNFPTCTFCFLLSVDESMVKSKSGRSRRGFPRANFRWLDNTRLLVRVQNFSSLDGTLDVEHCVAILRRIYIKREKSLARRYNAVKRSV